MHVMVAIADRAETIPVTSAPRARGQRERSGWSQSFCVIPRETSRFEHQSAPQQSRLVSCSRDPIGYDGSEWNLYEYVGGRPIVGIDPSGNFTVVIEGTLLGLGAVVIIAGVATTVTIGVLAYCAFNPGKCSLPKPKWPDEWGWGTQEIPKTNPPPKPKIDPPYFPPIQPPPTTSSPWPKCPEGECLCCDIKQYPADNPNSIDDESCKCGDPGACWDNYPFSACVDPDLQEPGKEPIEDPCHRKP